MCGIAGIVAIGSRRCLGPLGATVLARLEHRGPDDHGWLVYGRDHLRVGQGEPDDRPTEVMLLHRRLSILDLSAAGRQPMSTPDGRYHLIYNGEIYNYLELREELAALGYPFRTSCDTEVLLAALAQWGPAALPRLVGMFAFALLDVQARTLLLARDFFAIKPLYWSLTPDTFAFASEIKALLEVPGVSRRINPRALYGYLRHGRCSHTPETFLLAIQQVPSCHFLEFSLDEPTFPVPRQYWQIDPGYMADVSFEEAAKRLRELFLESVRLHLRSDVPVGTALSGGIDSSSIVMAVREVAGRRADFHTFSFVAGKDSPLDEERWVDLMTSVAGTTVHKVRVEPQELIADLDDLIAAQDEPFGSTSIYAQYRVFRLSQEAGIKVLLDGQGADEMLAGYPWYLHSRLMWLLREGRIGEAIHFIRRVRRQPGTGFLRLLFSTCRQLIPEWTETASRRVIAHRWAIDQGWFDRHGVNGTPPEDRLVQSSLRVSLLESFARTSLPELLRFEDRNSMAFGIESRVPFLTPQLVHFLFSLPDHYLINGDGTSKHVFRAAMCGIVPGAILDRRDKIGFATPELNWLRALRPWVDRVLRGEAARSIPALRHGAVCGQWRGVCSGRQRFDWRIWRWLNLIRWSETLGVRYDL